MKTFFQIVSIETSEVIRSIDVTNMSERMRERTERGALLNMNRDKYFTRFEDEVDCRPTVKDNFYPSDCAPFNP